MPAEGQTRTVKKMKEEIAKAKSKGTRKPQSNHNPQVVNESTQKAVDNSVQLQPNHNLEVVHNTEEHSIQKSIKEVFINKSDCVLNNQQIEILVQAGVDAREIEDALGHLLDAYRAEGLKPNAQALVDGVIQLALTGKGIQ